MEILLYIVIFIRYIIYVSDCDFTDILCILIN